MAQFTIPNAGLSDLVRRYQVCWEVWPEMSIAGGGATQVGFELELSGSDGTMQAFRPSYVHKALEAIAGWVLEKSENVIFEVTANSQSLRYSPVRGNRPDGTLSIKILHKTDFNSPVDQNERDYLERTKARLRAIGACEHQWYSVENEQGKMLTTA